MAMVVRGRRSPCGPAAPGERWVGAARGGRTWSFSSIWRSAAPAASCPAPARRTRTTRCCHTHRSVDEAGDGRLARRRDRAAPAPAPPSGTAPAIVAMSGEQKRREAGELDADLEATASSCLMLSLPLRACSHAGARGSSGSGTWSGRSDPSRRPFVFRHIVRGEGLDPVSRRGGRTPLMLTFSRAERRAPGTAGSSKARAARSTRASAPMGPTSWRPTGRPAAASRQGTEAEAWVVRVEKVAQGRPVAPGARPIRPTAAPACRSGGQRQRRREQQVECPVEADEGVAQLGPA